MRPDGLSATTRSLTPEETARRSDRWMMQKPEPRSNSSRTRTARVNPQARGRAATSRTKNEAATGLPRRRLVSAAGWTGGHPAVLATRLTLYLTLQAFAARLVRVCLGHSLRLLVAHRHLALRLFRNRLSLQAIVHEFLARLAFEFLFGRLRLARRHFGLLRIRLRRRLIVRRERRAAGKHGKQGEGQNFFHGSLVGGVFWGVAEGGRDEATTRRLPEATISVILSREVSHIFIMHRNMRSGSFALKSPKFLNFHGKAHFQRSAMILILEPNARPESTEYKVLTGQLDRLPGIQYRVHRGVGAEVTLTEISLSGTTGALTLEQMQVLPCVEKAVRVSEAYRVLGRHKQGDDRPSSFEYNGVKFGQDSLNVFAGLCAVDSPESGGAMMKALSDHGQVCTRMGAYKPRTNPYAFQGFGAKCLPYVFELAEKYGIKVISMEVTHESHVDEIRAALQATGDPTGVMLQIGTRNTQNFELL